MTNTTKIELSKLEQELMNNSEWILTKHSVMEKISALFSAQVPAIGKLFLPAGDLFGEIAAARPKISKGERYLDLPYMILDYPAVFSKEDIFALRTMFLWGNFISVTLHLSGKYKSFFQQKIIDNIDCENDDLYLAIGEDQWQQHFTEKVYVPVSTMKTRLQQQIIQHPFLKVACRYALEDVAEMDKNIKKACQYMAGFF